MQRVGGIRAGFIVALISDGYGGAWIGTEDGGVFHYSVDRKIIQFTTKNGLGDNNGYALAIDKIIIPFEKDTLKPIEKMKRITRMEHDASGRTTKIIQPHSQTYGEGPTTLHEFALSGNLIKKTDPLNNITIFSYDNLNRKISETNVEGGVTTFEYDSVGRMKSLTDPVSNTTSWSYNLLGRVSRERIVIDNVIYTRYFYYDSAENIVRKIDRNRRVTEWTFDGLNRHTSEIWYDDGNTWFKKTPSKKITTIYSNRGKIESVDDGDNKFTFAYGIFRNEIKQIQKLYDFEKPIEFNFVTDINGFNKEKIVKIDDKIDHTNKYEVDTSNRISKISQVTNNNDIKSVDIQYDNLGQRITQTRLDSDKPVIVTKNKFDTAGRLVNISHTGNSKTYADYDITWDKANRITDFDFTYLNGPAKKSESKYLYDKTS
jgi:YD repeat-containing protein